MTSVSEIPEDTGDVSRTNSLRQMFPGARTSSSDKSKRKKKSKTCSNLRLSCSLPSGGRSCEA